MKNPDSKACPPFMRSVSITAVIMSSLSLLVGCSPKFNQVSNGLDPQAESVANYYSVDPTPQNNDPLRAKLGRFFLVEHFTVENIPSMIQAIKSHQPGGIVFWNPKDADATDVREVIRTYSKVSKAAGQPPILFSADYEGGGLSFAPSGNMIPGIQRFHKGFTSLAHPSWLGEAQSKFGSELCSLHGKIMARELESVGINYPLSVTSDLAMRLFTVRGISKNPRVSTPCLEALADSFAAQGNSIFVTKHFPGLGQTLGDTHDTVAISQAKTPAEAEEHLSPFRNVIAYTNANKNWRSYSIMASHGKFPLYDAKSITTESPKILQDLLRTELGFQGLLVSDAMWMGSYQNLGHDALLEVYFKAFLSGMDMLMIPGSKFADSVGFFRDAYDNRLTPVVQAAVEAEMGLKWPEIHALYLARINESLARLSEVQSTLKQPADTVGRQGQLPTEITAPERKRYYDLLNLVDSRWVSILPKSTSAQ